MANAARAWGIVGVVSAAALHGCLDGNPKFIEPTATTGGGSTGAAETTSPPATSSPTGGPTTGVDATTAGPTGGPTGGTTEATTGDGVTTGPGSTTEPLPPVCGDGVLAGEEECDDGPNNSDDGACTSMCKSASCGDGLLYVGGEECDMGALNADDAACTSMCTQAVCGDGLLFPQEEKCDDGNQIVEDGCAKCQKPGTCEQVKSIVADPNLIKTGKHMVDPDGDGPGPLLPVWCDMTTSGGGWTLVERSPKSMPITKALFEPVMVNEGAPESEQYRMPKMVIQQMIDLSSELRIDCGKDDYLLLDAGWLFAGEFGPMDCNNLVKVNYKVARLKGVQIGPVTLCTGVYGKGKGCEGAWRIDETMQTACGLPELPWNEMQQASNGADLFAVDAKDFDAVIPPHDCHGPGAIREIRLR